MSAESIPAPISEQPQIDRQAIYAAIDRERAYQDVRRGFLHPVGSWLTVLRAELAEAELAWVKGHPDRSDALREILQIAAVCCACLEQNGLCERGM